jgi:hypothetical protein
LFDFINARFLIHGQTSIKTNAYEFSVKQGTKEWKQFVSIEKRIAALQIPDTVLRIISTDGLLQTCLEFPYLTDFLFANNYQEGFEALVAEFNGFRELLKRRDLTIVLLKKYNDMTSNVKNLNSMNEVEQGKFSFRHFILEFILAQDIVFENLSTEQEQQLFFLNSEHKKIKNNHPNVFSQLNVVPSNLLYAKKATRTTDFKFKPVKQDKVLRAGSSLFPSAKLLSSGHILKISRPPQ